MIFFERFSKKYSNIKFHTKAPRGSRVVPCGQTHGQPDRQTDRQAGITKLLGAFRNFTNVPETRIYLRYSVCVCVFFFGVLQVIHIKGMDMDTDCTTTTLITGGEGSALPRNSQSEMRGDNKKVEICTF